MSNAVNLLEVKELIYRLTLLKVDVDEELLDSGLIDSVGVIDLILEIENTFKIYVDPVLDRDSLRTISKLTEKINNALNN